MVETLLVLLYRKHQGCSVFGGGGSSLPQLFPAISYLDSEYAAELDTAHLAYLCGLSSRQFMQRFQAELSADAAAVSENRTDSEGVQDADKQRNGHSGYRSADGLSLAVQL